MSVAYPYAQGALLDQRNNYSYSVFQGTDFLAAWRASRAQLEEGAAAPGAPELAEAVRTDDEGGYPTRGVLEWLANHWGADGADTLAERLVQRFEVSKRLHRRYNERFRPPEGEDFRDLSLYVRFAEVFSSLYERSGRLPFLNALLKCMDTLTALRGELDAGERGRVAAVARVEARLVAALGAGIGGREVARESWARPESGEGGVLPGVLMIAANSARTAAYVQTLERRGLRPERVLLLGSGRMPAAVRGGGDCAGLHLPDLGVETEAFCRERGWTVEALPEVVDVNDPRLLERIEERRPELVIYSGFGGQIIGRQLLSVAPFLHAHAGWLPQYRGSTTLYYSLLREGACAVSVFIMAPRIDTGAVLARRRYSPPAPGVDVDYLYDNAIRADLMADVLTAWKGLGRLPTACEQQEPESETYYVIHPLLKHLAILSLSNEAEAAVRPWHLA